MKADPPPLTARDVAHADRCAKLLNAVRAQRGLAPINARIGADGAIISDATMASPESAGARRARGDNVDAVETVLAKARAPMRTKLIAMKAGMPQPHVCTVLRRLESRGRARRIVTGAGAALWEAAL